MPYNTPTHELTVAELLNLAAFGNSLSVTAPRVGWDSGTFSVSLHGLLLDRLGPIVDELERIGFVLDPDLNAAPGGDVYYLRARHRAGMWDIAFTGYAHTDSVLVPPPINLAEKLNNVETTTGEAA